MSRFWCVLAIVGCAPSAPAPAIVAAEPAISPFPCPGPGRCSDVYITAHPDDDLLFMNPDLAASIAVGNNVTLVVLTAGDDWANDMMADQSHNACGRLTHDDPDAYWRDRERGLLDAYSFMAGQTPLPGYVAGASAPPGWTMVSDPGHVSISVGGVELTQYALAVGGAQLSLVFVRLVDGEIECMWENVASCVYNGYHPEQGSSNANLQWARAGIQGIAPTQGVGASGGYSDGACVGCELRAPPVWPSYYGYTFGCAAADSRECTWSGADTPCAFPQGATGCCTQCEAVAGADLCTLGSAIPEQVIGPKSPTDPTTAHDELVGVLAGVIERFAATSVSTLDATNLYFDVLDGPQSFKANTCNLAHGTCDSAAALPCSSDADCVAVDGYTEHWSHYFGALFALSAAIEAQATMGTPLQLRTYRGYSLDREPVNITPPRQQQKRQTFARYWIYDDRDQLAKDSTLDDPVFDEWNYDTSWAERSYAQRSVVTTAAVTGRIQLGAAGDDTCLATTAGTLAIASCATAPSWQLTTTNQLELAGTGTCVRVADGNGHTLNPGIGHTRVTPSPADAVALAPCAEAPVAPATLFLFGTGQLRTIGARCLTAAAGAVTSDDCRQLCRDIASGELVEDVFCNPVVTGAQTSHVVGRPPSDQTWTLIPAANPDAATAAY